MTKQDKQLYALQSAARRQPDPVKRAKILDKIKEIKQRAEKLKWLAQ